MSTPFNYELDEYRIRQLLLNTTFDCTENDWQAFENLQIETDAIQKKGFTPSKTISVGISRNVVIPTLFIAGIGVFTLLLMNMINLKPRAESVPTEREVTPDPNQFKLKAVPVTAKNNNIKKESSIASTSVNLSLNESQKTATLTALQTTTPSPGITAGKNNGPVTPSVTPSETTVQTAKTTSSVTLNVTKAAETKTFTIKKPRKKRAAEVLETIQTPVILSNSGQEEEVELK